MNAVVDRVVQYPHRYQLKNVGTGEVLGTFDLEPITGTISVVGTKIDKALFDSIATDIGARLVANGGDAKDNIITYTIASDRNNIVSGEKLSVSFGKIAKYFNDLKAIAFSGNKADIGLGNVVNTADTAIPAKDSTDKFTSGGAYTELAKKVDKVAGSSLMTDAEHNKLSGIADGAEVNVNADWNATSGDAVILNKPTIPTVPVKSVNSKTGSVVLTGSDITTNNNDSETLDNKTIANMLHLGAYDTYVYDSTTEIYTITRQTGYYKLGTNSDTSLLVGSGVIKETGLLPPFDNYISGISNSSTITYGNPWVIDNRVGLAHNECNIFIKSSSNFSDLATYKTWIAETDLFVQYKLATPTTERLEKNHFARYNERFILEHNKQEAERSCNLNYATDISATSMIYGNCITLAPFDYKKGITYHLSFDTENTGAILYLNNHADLGINYTGTTANGTRRTFTFTPTKNCLNYVLKVSKNVDDGISTGICSNIMLNEGTTALPYQPYEGKVVHEKELDKKQDKLVSGSNIKTINDQSIVGAGNISITEGLFELIGHNVDTLDITKNETYFITAVAYNKIYVSENADIGFYGSSIISTISMLSGNPHIAINGFAYTLSSNKVTLITDGLMKVYKKKI